jgi:hypothetical protein
MNLGADSSAGWAAHLRITPGQIFDYLEKDQVVESLATTWLQRFAGRLRVN